MDLQQPTQFIKFVNFQGGNYDSMSANAKLAWAGLRDRLNSSVTRKEFFDKEQQDYYVIFTREDMASFLNCSLKTVTKVFAELVELGLLKVKRVFNGASKLFPLLPEEYCANNESVESTPPKRKKSNSKQTDSNQKKSTINTINTTISKILDLLGLSKSKKQLNLSSNDLNNQIMQQLELKYLVNATKTKGGMPAEAIDIIEKFSSQNPTRFKTYVGQIYRAKNAVLTNAMKQHVTNANQAFTFETNDTMSGQLTPALIRTFVASRKAGCQSQEETSAYLYTSLKGFFEEVGNEWLHQHHAA